MRILILSILCLLLASCTTVKNGTASQWVIGFGKVSYPVSDAPVRFVESRLFGLNVSNVEGPRFSAGFTYSCVVLVEDGVTNVLIEISKKSTIPRK